MEEDDNKLFSKALENFAIDNFNTSLSLFKTLSSRNPDKALYNLYTGICELKLKSYDKALDNFDKADRSLKNSFLVFFYRGVTLFHLKKYVEAKISFSNAIRFASTNEERARITPWMNKTIIEMECAGIIEYNSQLDQEMKLISNWIQDGGDLKVEITANKNLAEYNVKLESKRILLLDSNNVIKSGINLSNEIKPEESTFKISGMKIELVLKKKVPDFEWVMLEDNKCPSINNPNDISASGYYPSSSKVKKNWGVLEQEEENHDWNERTLFNGGDEGMLRLFKYIYSQADEDSKRAMIKSYYTSGGTVLSMNWDEVKDKDYEGKDRPQAPVGKEWAKKEK